MVNLFVFIFLVVCAAATVWLRKLTMAGALAGLCIGWLLYTGGGLTGLLMLAAFFTAATLATSLGARKKARMGMAENNAGQRTAGQVLANGGVAALAGLLAWLQPHQSSGWQLVAASALSAACADTLSSELGTLYGKRFYNILSFKKDKPGLNGVVSLEGTLCGMGGSILIASIYCAGYGYSIAAIWILIAGTAGNLADSILGASLERKGLLSNDLVNGLNTLVGGTVGFLLAVM